MRSGAGVVCDRWTWERTLREDSGITGSRLLVALVLATQVQGGVCRPGVEPLQRHTGLGRTQVKAHLRALRREGWLTVVAPSRRGVFTSYGIALPALLRLDEVPAVGGRPTDTQPVNGGRPTDTQPVNGGRPTDPQPVNGGRPTDPQPVNGGRPTDPTSVKTEEEPSSSVGNGTHDAREPAPPLAALPSQQDALDLLADRLVDRLPARIRTAIASSHEAFGVRRELSSALARGWSADQVLGTLTRCTFAEGTPIRQPARYIRSALQGRPARSVLDERPTPPAFIDLRPDFAGPADPPSEEWQARRAALRVST